RSVAVIDRDPGRGIGDRGDVGHGATSAARVVLPRGLGDHARAAAAGAAPGRLRPPSRDGGVLGEAGAADGGDVLGRGRELDAVAIVAGTHGQGVARVVVVAVVRARSLGAELIAAVAVGDGLGAHGCRPVDSGAEVGKGVRVRFDEQDVAVGADGRGHVEVQGDLLAPTDVARWKRTRLAVLVDLAEAGAVVRRS